jgi:type IV pilus assembly protein PilW
VNARHLHGATRGCGRQRGLSLIEMMVTMLIGAFLMIGVVAIFGQTRTAYRTNDTIERMQENVRFALNAMQPDLRQARNWGLHSKDANVDPPAGIAVTCAENGANVTAQVMQMVGVQASNGNFNALVPCPAFGAGWQAGSDVLVVRHASSQPTVATANVVQIQSDRGRSQLFQNGAAPDVENCPAPPAPRLRCTYDWEVNYYYVSASSSLGNAVPSLRRKTLVNGVLTDQELIAGVEDLQVQLGVDTGAPPKDNDVDRYVDADHNLVTPGAPGFDIDGNVLAVQLWLMFRAETPEIGFVDGNTYAYADVANFQPADNLRRALVNKTVMLRNTWEIP